MRASARAALALLVASVAACASPRASDDTSEARCASCHTAEFDRGVAKLPKHATFSKTSCEDCHTQTGWGDVLEGPPELPEPPVDGGSFVVPDDDAGGVTDSGAPEIVPAVDAGAAGPVATTHKPVVVKPVVKPTPSVVATTAPTPTTPTTTPTTATTTPKPDVHTGASRRRR